MKGTYDETLPSPRMKFNERDAASVAATTVLTQPIIVIASAIESMAVSVDSLSAGAVPSLSVSFVTAWLTQTIAVAILKTVSCFLRNHGSSFFRDLVAWVWRWWVLAAWDAMRESARAILPRRRSTPVRPRPDSPQPPSLGRRRPVRDAIRRRRGDQ